jgi:hypothetical protein
MDLAVVLTTHSFSNLKLLRGWAWHGSFIGYDLVHSVLLPRKDLTEYHPGSATAIQMAIVLEDSILCYDLYLTSAGIELKEHFAI